MLLDSKEKKTIDFVKDITVDQKYILGVMLHVFIRKSTEEKE